MFKYIDKYHVPLSDRKIWKETKIELYKILQKYDAIILESDNDIVQADLTKMHIATKPKAVPIAGQLYPLALKHHDFRKQEIKNLLDDRISHNSMSPYACPIVIVKKSHTRRCNTVVPLIHRLTGNWTPYYQQ